MPTQNNLRRFLISLFSLVLLAAFTHTVRAQAQQADVETLKNLPFLELVDLRVSLTSEIAGLEQQVKDLPKKIEEAEARDRFLSESNEKLRDLNDKKAKTDQDKSSIERLNQDISELKDRIGDKNAAFYKADLQIKQKDLDNKKTEMQNVRRALASIYTPEQAFKRIMSITFAALIGLVIIGFFFLSYLDGTMRQAIFSGETGIQFLTLFSLVIAIILFGITGILQDKELAALLGGLSGYILGRYSKPKNENTVPGGNEALPQPVNNPPSIASAPQSA